jgi:hypothetical protein
MGVGGMVGVFGDGDGDGDGDAYGDGDGDGERGDGWGALWAGEYMAWTI